MITTRPKCSKKLFDFIGDLMQMIPNAFYYPRGGWLSTHPHRILSHLSVSISLSASISSILSVSSVSSTYLSIYLSIYPSISLILFCLILNIQPGKYQVMDMANFAMTKGFTHLVVLSEKEKMCNGLLVTHLPVGPTAFFKLSSFFPGAKIPGP